MKMTRTFEQIPDANELADKSLLTIEQAETVLSFASNIFDINQVAWESLHGYSFPDILSHIFPPDSDESVR